VARIFISYRREDCPAHAGRLYDTLSARFGEANVFMDVDAIEPGADFVERIEQAVDGTDVLLAMIGDDWLTVLHDDGTRRIDRDDDFVRLEVARGLDRDHIRVIPVLVEGAAMPTAAVLPDPLKPLARRNGVVLTETRWRSDTSELAGAIAGTSGAPGVAAPAEPRKGDAVGTLLWLLAAALSLAGPVLIYAGSRAHRRSWVYAGLAYFAMTVIALGWSSAHPEDHALDWLFIGAWVASWLAGITHVLIARPRYRQREAVSSPMPLRSTTSSSRMRA